MIKVSWRDSKIDAKLKNTRTHKTISLPATFRPLQRSLAPQSWPASAPPGLGYRREHGEVMLGNVLLNFISYWIQWKHIHHLRKRKAFFQDLFGCNWISLQNEEGCTDRKQDALKNAWFPHEGCVKSRDGWWRGAGGLFVSPDFGIWPLPSSLALVGRSRPRFTSRAALSSLHPYMHPRPTSSNFRCKVSAWGSNLQNQVLFSIWKNKQGKQSYHVKCLFRENMTLSML